MGTISEAQPKVTDPTRGRWAALARSNPLADTQRQDQWSEQFDLPNRAPSLRRRRRLRRLATGEEPQPSFPRVQPSRCGVSAPRLTTSRCQCTASNCNGLFNSTTAFDRHRVGAFETADAASQRRCLTSSEMTAKGWLRNGAGFWITSAREASTTRVEGPSSTPPAMGVAGGSR